VGRWGGQAASVRYMATEQLNSCTAIAILSNMQALIHSITQHYDMAKGQGLFPQSATSIVQGKNSGASLDISARVGNMLMFVMSALSLSWRPPGLTMSRGYVHRTTQIMSSSVSGSLESSSEARATLPRSSPMRPIIRSDMAEDPSCDVNCAAISSEDSNRPCCMFNLTRDMRWRSSERAAVRNSCEFLGSTFPYSTAKGRKHSEDCNSRSSRNIRMTQYFRGIQAISFAIHGMSWLGLRTSSRTALTWNHYLRFNMIHQCSILLK